MTTATVVDVSSTVKTAAVIAINGYRLHPDIFGDEDGFKAFFDSFESDPVLAEALGLTIKCVRLIVKAYVTFTVRWTSMMSTASPSDLHINPHLFVVLIYKAISVSDGDVTLSARPSNVLGSYITIAVDDGDAFNDEKYRDLVMQILGDTTGQSQGQWPSVKYPMPVSKVVDAVGLFVAAIKDVAANSDIVVDLTVLRGKLATIAASTRAFYNAVLPDHPVGRAPVTRR